MSRRRRSMEAHPARKGHGPIRSAAVCAFLLWAFVPLSAATSPVAVEDSAFAGKIRESIDHIYNIEFDQAEEILRPLVREHPEHPAGHFFLAMVEWWRILITFDDESRDDRFYRMLEGVIDVCDRRLKKDPRDVTALFFKGGSIGFRGRLRANRGSWFSAASDGIGALPIVRKAYELDPRNKDILLGIGIYNYYADVVPEKYPIVKPLLMFFPSGDRRAGLRQLREASDEGTYARVEATYFLMQNMYLFEKDFRAALDLATKLHEAYPRNPVFHRYLGRCYISLGRLNEAARVFAGVADRYGKQQEGYDTYDGREAFYYLGRYHFFRGEFDEARERFLQSDQLSRKVDKEGPSGFRAMANLHLGMISDARGKREEAKQYYRIVLAMDEYQRSHRDARAYLKAPYRRGS